MAEHRTVIDNTENERFEINEDGEVAFLEYRWHDGKLVLMHTLVPSKLEGKGLASELAHFALELARSKNVKVRVYCSFVNGYLKRHPEYGDVVVSS